MSIQTKIKRNTNLYVLILVGIVFIMSCLIGVKASFLLYLLFVFFIYVFIYSLLNIERYISVLLFFACLFTFLLGRIFLPILLGDSYIEDNFYTSYSFSEKTLNHVYLSLFLTVYFVFVAFSYFQRKLPYYLRARFDSESKLIKHIRKTAKNFIFLTIPFACLQIIDKIRFVLQNGYQTFFMDYESNLPSIILVFAILFGYMVFLYLATLPSKSEVRNIIILYLLISASNMLAGDREEAVLSILVVVFYYSLRNRLNSGSKPWITKKVYLLLVCIVPFLIILFFLMSFFRNETQIDNTDIAYLITGFFYQQGASMNVIACSYDSYNLLPVGKLYSLGAINDYFRNNYLSQFLFGIKPYPIGSVELAKNGNSLDSAITYIEDSNYFFAGGGMGSCFIAEAWHDFGYIGVAFFAMFYGYVLAEIPKWCSKNIWISVVAIIFLKFIMFAPRARATSFIASALSVSFWPVAFFIYLYSVNKTKFPK